jgi:hypothetical protein
VKVYILDCSQCDYGIITRARGTRYVIQNSNIHPRVWLYYRHIQDKDINHHSTGLCIKKFSVINMWICHAVKTALWFCGVGQAKSLLKCWYSCNIWATVIESMPSVVQLSQSRSADYKLSYNASKLVITLANWKQKESFCNICLNKKYWITTVFQYLSLFAPHISWCLHLELQKRKSVQDISVSFSQQLKLPIFSFPAI